MCKNKNKQIVTEYEYDMNTTFKILINTIKIIIKLSITNIFKFKNIYARIAINYFINLLIQYILLCHIRIAKIKYFFIYLYMCKVYMIFV